MGQHHLNSGAQKLPRLARLPAPAKALVSVIILTMAIAIVGALGQIIVHDIIPTFFSDPQSGHLDDSERSDGQAPERGDLFTEESLQAERPQKQAWYLTEKFVWNLKWTHIHLFGMNMIFIFMGAITVFLNISLRARTWLVILPFIGVLIDISAVWLKSYISPTFFWLHIPGGGLFGITFVLVSARAVWEMYAERKHDMSH